MGAAAHEMKGASLGRNYSEQLEAEIELMSAWEAAVAAAAAGDERQKGPGTDPLFEKENNTHRLRGSKG